MSRPVTPLLVAVLAGALWPLLVIGLLEVLCVVRLARRLRHADGAHRDEPPAVGADALTSTS
jgi:hypothetical protein